MRHDGVNAIPKFLKCRSSSHSSSTPFLHFALMHSIVLYTHQFYVFHVLTCECYNTIPFLKSILLCRTYFLHKIEEEEQKIDEKLQLLAVAWHLHLSSYNQNGLVHIYIVKSSHWQTALTVFPPISASSRWLSAKHPFTLLHSAAFSVPFISFFSYSHKLVHDFLLLKS